MPSPAAPARTVKGKVLPSTQDSHKASNSSLLLFGWQKQLAPGACAHMTSPGSLAHTFMNAPSTSTALTPTWQLWLDPKTPNLRPHRLQKLGSIGQECPHPSVIPADDTIHSHSLSSWPLVIAAIADMGQWVRYHGETVKKRLNKEIEQTALIRHRVLGIDRPFCAFLPFPFPCMFPHHSLTNPFQLPGLWDMHSYQLLVFLTMQNSHYVLLYCFVLVCVSRVLAHFLLFSSCAPHHVFFLFLFFFCTAAVLNLSS